jgi:hypothetical protein
MTIKLIKCTNLPVTDELPGLLRDAAAALDCRNPESAAWRLADACLLLRRRLKNAQGVAGVDEPTGRGAVLGGLPA